MTETKMTNAKAADKVAKYADKSTELEARKAVFDTDQLTDVKSWEDVASLFAETGVKAESIADYGDGFEMLTDKDKLVKQEFIVLQWQFTKSDKYLTKEGNPTEFVAARIMLRDGRKFVMIDGSTGICQQLQNVTARRIAAGHAHPYQAAYCEKGLRASVYEATDGNGHPTTATTYYLAM